MLPKVPGGIEVLGGALERMRMKGGRARTVPTQKVQIQGTHLTLPYLPLPRYSLRATAEKHS